MRGFLKRRTKNEELDEIVRQLTVEKLSRQQVADLHGLTVDSLYQLIKRHHLVVPMRDDAPKTGITAWKKPINLEENS